MIKLNVELPKFSKFKVSKKDIKDGEQGEASYCPLALCIRREFAAQGIDLEEVNVKQGSATISYTTPIEINVNGATHQVDVEVSGTLNLEKRADTFIDEFDEDGVKGVKPGTFKAKPVLSAAFV